MRLLAALLCLGITLSGCASLPGGSFSIEAPEWSPGHTWTYSQVGTYHVDSDHEKTDRQEFSDEDTTLTVLRNHTDWDQEGWLLSVEGERINAPGMPYGPAIWVRTGDLRAASLWDLVSIDCEIDACSSYVDPYPDTSMPEQSGTFMPFPLERDTRWTYEFQGDEYRGEVLGVTPVETGLGDLRAIQVRFTVEQPDWEEEVVEMEENGATVYRYDVEMDATIDLFYVPEAEWFGRISTQRDITYDIDVDWGGDRWTDKGTVAITEEVVLEDFDLAVEAPATDDEILEAVAQEPGWVSTPYPQGPVDANVTVTVTAPDEAVNTNEADEVELAVGAVGDNGPYRHEWSAIVPGESYADETDEGATFTLPLEELGTYAVEVRTYDANGTYVHVDVVEVEAYYGDAMEGTCSMSVQILSVGSCDPIDFPVTSYWDSEITVTAEHAGGLLEDGYLQLIDAYGDVVVQKDLSNGKATISGDYYGSRGLWSARVVPPTGADDGSAVSYTVEVHSSEQAWYYPYYY